MNCFNSRSIVLGAISLAIILHATPSRAQVSTIPVNPRPLETVRAAIDGVAIVADAIQRGFNSYDPRYTQVSMAGNKITVSLLLGYSGIPTAYSPPIEQPLGQFPPGTYQVEIARRTMDGTNLGIVGTTTFTIAARAPSEPLLNLTDLWWNPVESGWALSIVQHGTGKLFATWFVYGSGGVPTWYVIPDGQWISATEFRGPIYRTSGPGFEGAFDAAAVTRTLVGTAAIGFFAYDFKQAGFTFVIDGKTIQKTIVRH